MTSPPLGDQQIKDKPSLLEGFELLVFNLHGLPFEPCWYGDGGKAALRKTTLESLSLEDCGVFAVNCHLGDPYQPMFKALRKAGVGYVVAGEGPNYSGSIKPVGATVLLRWFVSFVDKATPENALKSAKVMTALCAPKWSPRLIRAMNDALKFKIWRF